ncbi:Monosaccharide-transporting ATPase protein [Dioscorea alata]|uniref:Monosaccharide-transporting ATPase protein n=1 Tax=Dioscorea alata TaxID=55571 RepID=A0ACB7TU26_DIOAL|nr:Monosaccharide-transporting ATPase protein [Dioscorea alata]
MQSRRGSLRQSSISNWRDSSAIFSSRTSQVEDDEEALLWAAIEKLPTYDRLRRAILPSGSQGRPTEFDVQDLSNQDRDTLIKRLLHASNDNQEFLLKLRDRLDRVGLDLPTIEIRFESLKLQVEAHLGSRALPTILNFLTNILESIANRLHILPSQKKTVTILQETSGIIKPNRLTLLLGPPGSGKTTLLLALAGRLSPDIKVSGKVSYNGHGMNEFVPQRTAAYVSQYDLHIGELTVRETLAFSARCQGSGSIHEMIAELSRREATAGIKPDPDIDAFLKAAAIKGQNGNVFVDYILKMLGLDVCADTFVGDQMIRGISGGQRRRVTTGEMLVGPARALMMDEISTGLDSSTTYQIVNSIKQSIHILNETAVISLLQPAPETYNLFDDVILLSEGQIAYHGPREHVLNFFESMGFKCPDRKSVPDFLQEVISRKDQKQYWVMHNEMPYRFIPVKEFADAFQKFHVGLKLREELSVPFDKSKSHPAALATSTYGVSRMELLKACTQREFLLIKRNLVAYILATIKISITAFFTMTLFLRTEMHRDSQIDGLIFMGVLFFTIFMAFINGFQELAMTTAKLPVFYKQKDLLFYTAWAYTLPSWILKIPFTLAEATIWVFMSYYVVGFDPNVGRLFKQFLLVIWVIQTANSLFRVIGAVTGDPVIGTKFAGLIIVAIMATGGFLLPRGRVKKWWKWLYWSSPIMYAQQAISTNEFLGQSWCHFLSNSTESLGLSVMKLYGIFPEKKWYWIGLAALVGYTLLFNALYPLALTCLTWKAIQTISSEDQQTSTEETRSGTHSQVATEVSTDTEQGRRGMVLPFAPLSITFQDIRYSVDMPLELKAQGVQEDRLMLLKGVSGAFRPGVLTALMGVSGAGKTTLMDVLAGRKTGGYMDGTITVSGYPKKQQTFARVSGYCEQNDIHSPNVTVYESLLFSAWLRLPATTDSATRKMFIEEVMELVELTSIQGALVGLPGVSGLSTERRKRLTIAVELVANPSIIFMDEPTSGLDARAAAIVMRTVRNTVNTGRTIVCTIHQPSIDIFETFDELFLMKRGGEEIYVGPIGHQSCHLINYFQGIQGVSKMDQGYNPSTWALEVTTISQEERLGVNFSEIYKNSDHFRRNKALIEELSKPTEGSEDLYFPTKYPQSFRVQCSVCFWKHLLSYWRNPPYIAFQILITILIGLVTGSIFWDIASKKKNSQDISNAMGSMYLAIVFLGAQNTLSVIPVLAIERLIYYRERAAGMYSSFPYAFGLLAVELLCIWIQSTAYVVIVYPMMGMEWTAAKFFWFLFFTYFTLIYFTFFGMMSAALTPNEQIGAMLATFLLGVWMLFAGFLLPRKRIRGWWIWSYWACPLAWSLYGMVASQFGNVNDVLQHSGETVAEFVERYYGFKHDWLGWVAVAHIGFGALFAFIYAFSIKVLNFQKR